ncbi:GAP1-N2 domain-containing protein [Paenibacillus wenxiniae]|uniref:Glycosyltransferase n=1 Tax=Paenibacillus wenxiniae TaxID=1636843 RepID=A0ABW4RLX3_9BACL
MNLVSDARIQQQLYTREKNGIFRTTEGYDTVARSPGLDLSFIKKNIHPLCAYDAPTELQAQGEKDASLYPAALQLVRLDNRDLVLGQSVYVPTDFTGLRSAFFTHNYVIPAVRGEEWVHHYDRWLHADFREQYDTEQGAELDELEEVPVRPSIPVLNPQAVLTELGLDETLFRQLLGAVMSAIHRHRKVYISLNVPVRDLPVQANRLLHVLMLALPYAFRRRLGFTTYAKEPESRKGMQILFVESGSIRAGDRNLEREYIFDLSSGRIQAAQAGKAGQLYIDYAWQHLTRPDQLKQLQEFADHGQAGIDAASEALPDPAQYDEWTMLYRVEQGDESLYSSHRAQILQTLLRHLRPEGALETAMRLNDLFLSRFDREFDRVRAGEVPETAVASAFADYYEIDPQHTGRKIVNYFVLAIHSAVSRQQGTDVQALYALLEKYPPLYEEFLKFVGGQPKLAAQLLTPLIERKFRQAASVEDVIRLTAEWGSRYPQLLELDDYRLQAGQAFMEALRGSRDMLAAASEVFRLLDRLESGKQPDVNEQAWRQSGIGEQMRVVTERILLSELEWSTLTRSRLLQADFLGYPLPSDEDPSRAERRLNGKKRALQLLYCWFDDSATSMDVDWIEEMDKLPPAEKDEVQKLGRSWLGEDIRNGRFERLPVAFAYSSTVNDLDYSTLVDEVRKQAPSPQTMYDFFAWSDGQPAFMISNDGATGERRRERTTERSNDRNRETTGSRGLSGKPRFVPAYEAAILSYFRKHDREAFRRSPLKQGALANKPALAAVYDRARDELATPWQKWLRRNRRRMPMLIIAGLLGLGAIGGLSVYFVNVFGGNQTVATVPQTTPQPTPVINPDELPDILVTLSSSRSSSGTSSDSNGQSSNADNAGTNGSTASNAVAAASAAPTITLVSSSATGTTDNGASTSNSVDTGSDSGSANDAAGTTDKQNSQNGTERARLVFHFKMMEPCVAFEPKKATLLLKDGQQINYEKLDPQLSCGTSESAESTDSESGSTSSNDRSTSSETSKGTEVGSTSSTKGTSSSTTDKMDASGTSSNSATDKTNSSDPASSSTGGSSGATDQAGSSSSTADTSGSENSVQAPASLELTAAELQQVYPYEVSLALPAGTNTNNLQSIRIGAQQYIITTLSGTTTDTTTDTTTN